MAERGFPYYQQTVRRIEEAQEVSVGEATPSRKSWEPPWTASPGRAGPGAGMLDEIARG